MEGEAACLKPPGAGAASFEHVGDVGGHGGGDGTGDAVVDGGLTKESASNGVGFGMVLSRESIYKAVEVGDVTAFDAVVVNYEGKINGVGGVGEEAAGLELAVATGQQEGGDLLLVGVEARLLKTRCGFIAAGTKKWFALFILLDERGDAEAGDEEFRRGHVVSEVEVGDVEGAKRSVFRDGGVEKDVDHRRWRRCWWRLPSTQRDNGLPQHSHELGGQWPPWPIFLWEQGCSTLVIWNVC
jgi:hypothetical protein